MTDDAPDDFLERRKYRRYKFELICSDQTVRDDLEFLRISEEGARISIMPTGEKDVTRSVKFIVKNKSFHEIYNDDSILPAPYINVQTLIDFMMGDSKIAGGVVSVGPLQTAPIIRGTPGDRVSQMGFQTAGAVGAVGAAEYRLTPVAKRLGSGPVPAAASTLPRPAGFVIPDKYKIKRGDGTISEK